MAFLSPNDIINLVEETAKPSSHGGNNYSIKLPENYEELKKDPSVGEATLNGHKYIVGTGSSTVDGEKVNSPTLGVKGGEVYYYDVGGKSWNQLKNSDMEKVIIGSIAKKYEPKPEPNS